MVKVPKSFWDNVGRFGHWRVIEIPIQLKIKAFSKDWEQSVHLQNRALICITFTKFPKMHDWNKSDKYNNRMTFCWIFHYLGMEIILQAITRKISGIASASVSVVNIILGNDKCRTTIYSVWLQPRSKQPWVQLHWNNSNISADWSLGTPIGVLELGQLSPMKLIRIRQSHYLN